MKNNEVLQKFLLELKQEVINKSAIDDMEDFRENVFTQIVIDYLCETGQIEDGNITYYYNKQRGLKVNGFSLDEEDKKITLYVSHYVGASELFTLPPSEASNYLRRARSFFQKSVEGFHSKIEEAYGAFDLAKSIYELSSDINEVRIMLFTNGTVRSTELVNEEIEGTFYNYEIWDLNKIFREITSGTDREKIELNLLELSGRKLECIKVNVPLKKTEQGEEVIESGGYTSYFTVIPGDVLFAIYEKYNARLLERNVRAFLQARGNKSVNGGIKNTILNTPEMFLAYNNGISATAEQVQIDSETETTAVISGLKDFQIVNGGQTTASIYNTCKKEKQPLNEIFVQAKITVLNDQSKMDDVVPMISKCANTQNKVQMADFSANDEFHVKFEELSRTVWAPAKSGGEQQTKWFYERARGQYMDTKSRENSKKYFDKIYPQKQYFDKLKLARYENSWDQMPHITSKGGQASFRHFTLRLKQRGKFIPDLVYYQNLIAKAIFYQRVYSIVRSQKFLGFWANVADYTVAYLSYKTAQRIDLNQIWKDQALSVELEKVIVDAANMIYEYIAESANGQNPTQWCKKEACWNGLKEKSFTIPDMLEKELVAIGKKTVSSVSQNIESATEDESKLISDIKQIESSTWFDVSSWAKETSNLKPYQRSIAFTLGKYASQGKEPSRKQAIQGLLIVKEAKKLGFEIPEFDESMIERHSGFIE